MARMWQRHGPRRCSARARRRVVAALRERAARRWPSATVAAIIDEVPSYAGALERRDGREHRGRGADGARRLPQAGRRQPRAPTPARRSARRSRAPTQLGRGEARSGRSMDALLAAYRVGARVAWREMSAAAVRGRASTPATLAQFAELVFAYIDELSAASVAGHTDELATTGRVRAALPRAARPAPARRRRPPTCSPRRPSAPTGRRRATLTAVLLPAAQVRGVLALARRRHAAGRRGPARRRAGERPSRCPAAGARRRRPPAAGTCCGSSTGRQAVVGPARPVAAVRGRRTTGRCGPSRWPAAPRARAPSTPRSTSPSWCVERRPRGARRPAGPGARAAGRPATRRPREKLDRDAAVLAAAPGPPRRGRRRAVRARRRRCATGWASCASCTATGSTTRARCSSSSSRLHGTTTPGTGVAATGRHGGS